MPNPPDAQRVLADISCSTADGMRVTLTHPNGTVLSLSGPPVPSTLLDAGAMLTDMLYPAVLAALMQVVETPSDRVGLTLMNAIYQSRPDAYMMNQLVFINDLHDPEALQRFVEGGQG